MNGSVKYEFPVGGFLCCRCNRPNQTELINSDLINQAIEKRVLLGGAQEGRGLNTRTHRQIYGPGLKK